MFNFKSYNKAGSVQEAIQLLQENPGKAREYLTGISVDACEEATATYWNLGDLLWSKYDEKW